MVVRDMFPLLSIVVPIYNSEQYLADCIDSILRQSYTNIELLLVNDGSTDHSAAICDYYADKDGRVKVIHKANGGQGSARNVGIACASGDYITFVDSDDVISSDVYTENVKVLINDKSIDFVQFPCIVKYGSKNQYIKYSKEGIISGNINLFISWLKRKDISNYVCNKIFRIVFFKSLRFPEGFFFEDRYLMSEILETANKVYLNNKGCYFYYERPNQVTSKPESEFILQSKYKADMNIVAHIKDYSSLNSQCIERFYNCFYYAERMSNYNLKLSELMIEELKKIAPSYKKLLLSTNPIGIKVRLLRLKLFNL